MLERPLEDDRALVDRIVYMGTLASERSVIDPLMDTLRLVTTRWHGNQPLEASDRTQLLELETRLKDYLTHRDPIRMFAAAELEARLRKQTDGSASANRYSVYFWLTILISTAVAAAVFAITASSSLSLESRIVLPAPFFFLVLQFGSIWFYLSAVKRFNPAFRRAFVFVCAGVLSMALLYIELIAVTLFKLDRFPAFQYAGITGLVSLQFIWMYVGFRAYCRLLAARSRFLSLKLLAALLVLAPVLAIIVPRKQPVAALYFDISFACFVVLFVFVLFDAGLTRQIVRHVTPAYAKSMQWLYWYFASSLPAVVGVCVLIAVRGTLKGNALNITEVALGILPQILLLYTGYLFKKETSG
ncbi:MAG TPA: hypothetical protein VJP80_06220 [Candidatus Saccharimonadales bacterium]|nr:hypothetical protein [Candidatus Saccharimonadales bacterium]